MACTPAPAPDKPASAPIAEPAAARPKLGGCTVSVSLSPVDDLPAPRWSACDNIEGCQVMYFPDTETDDYQVFGRDTAAGPMIAVARVHGLRTTLTLRPLDGSPFLAATIDGTYTACDVSVVLTEDWASFAVTDDDPDHPHDRLFFAGPLHGDPVWKTPVGRALNTGVSGRHALQGRSIVLFDAQARLLRPGPDGASPLLADPQIQDIDWLEGVGDALLFGAHEPRGSIWLLRPDHPPQQLLQLQEGEELPSLVVDGDQLHWTVRQRVLGTTPPKYSLLELWTATLPVNSGPLVARQLPDHMSPLWAAIPLYAGAGKVAYIRHPGKGEAPYAIVIDGESDSVHYHNDSPHPEMGLPVLMTPEAVVVTLGPRFGPEIFGLARFRHDRPSFRWGPS